MYYNFNFDLETQGLEIIYPTFVSSFTMSAKKQEPEWKKPDEIMDYLKKNGSPFKSKGTLSNLEKKGLIATLRISERKIFYDLNDIKKLVENKYKK